ncbi:MAG: 50S ribosomal protein L9 [Dehalococcoidia bacterium]|nr:50S ribosomal protein L9 [Dehalococcoidia bacterium]
MKVVFLEEVPGSGLPGDVRDVADGFARNYLLPKNLAVAANKQMLEKATRLAEAEAKRQEKLDKEASGIAGMLDGQAVTFTVRVGDQGRLFGSITAGDIAEEATKLAGEQIDRHKVHLGEPIKEIGSRPVRVRLSRNVEVELTVNVEDQDAPAESEQAVEAEAETEPAEEEAKAKPDEEEAEAASAEGDGAEEAAEEEK